jgi:hypothetical protein
MADSLTQMTDCQILNTGFPAADAENCCTQTEVITCDENGRVIRLIDEDGFFNTASDIELNFPVDIGDLTELVQISLKSGSRLYGELPISLNKLTKIQIFEVFNSKISGSMVTFDGAVDSLR